MPLRTIVIDWSQARVLENETMTKSFNVTDTVKFLPAPPGTGTPIVVFPGESPFSTKRVEGTDEQQVRPDADKARSATFRFKCSVRTADGVEHTAEGGEIPRPPKSG
jgi:hypothetical protein